MLLTFDYGNYAGVMELGICPFVRKQIYGKSVIREEKDFAYIGPVKCRAKYRNVMKAGLLRLSSFLEWA